MYENNFSNLESRFNDLHTSKGTPSSFSKPVKKTAPSKQGVAHIKDHPTQPVAKKFQLESVRILQEIVLANQDLNLAEYYKSAQQYLSTTFAEFIDTKNVKPVEERDYISLMDLTLNPALLGDLYPPAVLGTDPSLTETQAALVLRFQRLQIKLATMYITLEGLKPKSELLLTTQKQIIQKLNTSKFLRLPSMLKTIEGGKPSTYLSTFHHIAKIVKPIEATLRELLHIVCVRKYGSDYDRFTPTPVLNLIDDLAPLGFESPQKDIYYLLQALVNPLTLDKNHLTQWMQYRREILDLISLISTYPRQMGRDLLIKHCNTQVINIPVSQFFKLSENTTMSNTVFSNFIGRGNRFISLLWMGLFLTVVVNSSSSVEHK